MVGKLEYRPCVVGVFVNDSGGVLVGERANVPGAWQFPQGGIEPGESTLSALYREMREEIGTGLFKVVGIASRQVSYVFPVGLNTGAAKCYRGQTQYWYKLMFTDGAIPEPSKADGELVAFAWQMPGKVVENIVDWKRDAYAAGLRLLGFDLPT